MSSLWTPEGEHPVGDPRRRVPGPTAAPAAGAAPAGAEPTGATGTGPPPAAGHGDVGAEDEALAAHLDELRRQLVSTPAEVVVANHVYGLFELAAIHLSQQPPHLDQARLAVDAMGAVVEALAGRLGDAEDSLVAALAQIRLAYVQITGAVRAPGPGEPSPPRPGSDPAPGSPSGP